MADAKKTPELSDAYYSHKRTTLLYSVALFAFSLPSVTISPGHTLGWTIRGIDPGFARVALMLATVYYLINFWLIWRTEAVAYSRAADHGEANVVEALTEFMKEYATTEHQLGRSAELVVEDIQNPNVAAAAAAGMAIDEKALEETVVKHMYRLQETVNDASGARLQEQIGQVLEGEEFAAARARLQHVRFGPWRHEGQTYGQMIASDLQEQWSTISFTHEQLVAARTQAGQKLAEMAAVTQAMNSKMAEIRADLRVGPATRKALIVGVDLVVPTFLFLVAMLHFVGTCMRYPLLPDLATGLGF